MPTTSSQQRPRRVAQSRDRRNPLRPHSVGQPPAKTKCQAPSSAGTLVCRPLVSSAEVLFWR
jgi:hypothetical protein